MKKIYLFSAVILMTTSIFAQMKYKPKVVVLFLGAKNPTFDESKYPDITFYYTPGLVKEKLHETSGNKTKEALSVLTGYGNASANAQNNHFKGSPEEIEKLGVYGKECFFDKKATFIGQIYSVTDNGTYRGGNVMLTAKRKTVVTGDGAIYETIPITDLTKKYIKKGKKLKAPKNKKIKKKDNPDLYIFLYGKQWPDFKVEDASGKEVSFNSIMSDAPLTMVSITYMDPNADLNLGKESGEGKTGKEFTNDVLKSMTTGVPSNLSEIESEIFGYRV